MDDGHVVHISRYSVCARACVRLCFIVCVQCMYTCFHRKCAGINIKYLFVLPNAMSNLGMIIDSNSVNIYF